MSKTGNKKLAKWTAEITVEFVSLPPEKEKTYWAALDYFAGKMSKYMIEEGLILNPKDGAKDIKEPSSPAKE